MQTSIRKRAALAATLALGLLGATLPIAGAANARPVLAPDHSGFVDSSRVIRFGGERYCWYDTGWSGHGWYLCGDNWWRGHGWYSWRRPLLIPRHHHHAAPQPGKPPRPPSDPAHPGGGHGGGPRPPR